MNLKKKELIISVIIIIAFLIIGLNADVLAVSTNTNFTNLTLTTNTSNTTNNNMIEIVNSNTQNNATTNTNNTNTNTPGQLADTGLEDLPWLVIGVCVVSAIFAYKKIKEYKAY